MRLPRLLLSLSLGLGPLVVPTGSAAAGPTFADTICPNAAPAVMALGGLKTSDPPERIYEAAHAAAAAYEACGRTQLADGNAEPGLHYAYTRQAGFGVVAARALLRLNRVDEARRELEAERRIASEVVDWRLGGTRVTSSANVNGTNDVTRTGDTRGSVYAASAKEIVAAIDAELAKFAGPTPGPKPSP